MKDFNNKVAVITGAASGIGRSLAERCLREGMKVVLADIEQSALDQTEAELAASGGTVLAVRTDVSSRTDVERLAQRTIEAFGQVHLLFNNAGIAAGGAAWEASWHDWEWVIGVNLWGVVNGVKVFTPLMLAQNTECHIVNTASAAGLVLGSGSAPYAVSKHGVVALSESLYVSLEERQSLVRVSVLCPGLVHTNIFAAERNRPEALRNPPAEVTPEMQAIFASLRTAMEMSMPPAQVADQVFAAIRREQFYILTHPEWMDVIQLRTEKLLGLENPESPVPAIIRLMHSRAHAHTPGE